MRKFWPSTLEACLDEVIEPVCLSSCPFRLTCPTHIQEGIHKLFVEEVYTRPQDCLWWPKLAALTRTTLGIDPPKTAEELIEALGERRAIQEVE